MKRTILAVAMLALALPALSPAHAAPPAGQPKVTFGADGAFELSDAFADEMYCTYDTAGYNVMDLLAEAIVEGFDETISFKNMQDASATCAKKFGWSDKERNWSELIAENDAIELYAEDMMLSKAINNDVMQGVWNSLTLDDRIAFLDDGSMKDEARGKRAEAALKAAGVEDDEETLFYGKVALVAISFIYAARDSWIETLRTN